MWEFSESAKPILARRGPKAGNFKRGWWGVEASFSMLTHPLDTV